MSDQVSICNQALSRISAKRISSLSDNTIEANQMAAIFDSVSRRVQADGPWPCNKFRATLAQDTATPAFGFAFQYTLPTDPLCLRVLLVNEDELGEIDYQIEAGKLITDESSVGILYLGWVTDPNVWDVYLEEAVIDQLTAEISQRITGQITVSQAAFKYAAENREKLLNKASIQGSSTSWPSDSFVDIRRSF